MSGEAKKPIHTKLTILRGRLSFEHLWEPQVYVDAKGNKSDPRYSVNVLIPIGGMQTQCKWFGTVPPTPAPFEHAIWWAKCAAVREKAPNKDDAFIQAIDRDNYCYRVGKVLTYDGYAGMDHIMASSPNPVPLYGPGKRLLSKDDAQDKKLIYSGVWANVYINLYYLSTETSKITTAPSVYAGLNAVQFVAHDTPFSNKGISEDELEDTDDSDEEIGSDTPPPPPTPPGTPDNQIGSQPAPPAAPSV